ncbi:hypothetical protein BDN72DRAFT_294850 [Pluteus cervinus]|uniref:Uncharacterized protein n=1 Tax=Pluteus cervinus TaxID=181527 RepID=A0ACD3B356_9AGAR|nr:hypothetical protein BDN72DRAFT_294850 [Pluteus cervinus]
MTRLGSSELFRSPFATSSTLKYNKAQEIAHLLDPSYIGQQPISSAPYLDSDGILHDPDYRYFPVVTQPVSKRRRASDTISPFASTPRWELGATYDEDLEDEDESDEWQYTSYSNDYPSNAYRQFVSRSSSPKTAQRNLDAYRQRHSYATSSYSPVPALSTSLSTTASTSSYSSSPTLSNLHSHEASFTEEKKGVFGFAKRCASKASSKRRSIDRVLEEKQDSQEEEHDNSWISYAYPPEESLETENESQQIHAEQEQQSSEEAEEWTPTCKEALKFQWYLISRKFRWAYYSAQRRLRLRARP